MNYQYKALLFNAIAATHSQGDDMFIGFNDLYEFIYEEKVNIFCDYYLFVECALGFLAIDQLKTKVLYINKFTSVQHGYHIYILK